MTGTLRLDSWDALKDVALPLRMAVFVDEQRVPAEMELDEHDPLSLHAVLPDDDGSALATGRLLPASRHGEDCHMVGAGGMARIGRMAVRHDRRGLGLGAQVLDALVQASRHRGDAGVLLHAQCSALGFYARRGFAARGERFDEAGIEHVEMVLLHA